MARPIYTPKVKRTPPKYTMGNEYVYEITREEYVGLYNKYPNGSIMSVATDDMPEQELVVMTTADRSPNTSRYAQITGRQFYRHYQPILYYPTITAKDKEAGFIRRAFAQKINEPDLIIEITPAEAQKANERNAPGIDLNQYNVSILTWAIAGSSKSIRDRNAKAVADMEKVLPGIKEFLSDLDEFSNSVVKLT